MDGFLDFYTPRPEELPLEETPFCSFDFETTGLYPERHEIIEIGAVRLVNGKELDSFSSFVRPVRSIPAEATTIHGIDGAMVADAPPLAELLPGLLEFLADSILVAHNINFDLAFLKAACAAAGLKMPKGPYLDTCTFARVVLKGESGYSLQGLSRRHRLGDGRPHRALDDARLAAALLSLIVGRVPDAVGLTGRELIRLSKTRPFS